MFEFADARINQTLIRVAGAIEPAWSSAWAPSMRFSRCGRPGSVCTQRVGYSRRDIRGSDPELGNAEPGVFPITRQRVKSRECQWSTCQLTTSPVSTILWVA